MKKYVAFLVSFAISMSAWATPQTHTVRLVDVVNTSKARSTFNEYLKDHPALMNAKLSYQIIDANTVVVLHGSKKIKFEKISDNSLKVNGKLVEFAANETIDTALEKMDSAYQAKSFTAVLLEMLFASEAQAFEPTMVAISVLGLLLFGGFNFLLGRITSPWRPRPSSLMAPVAVGTAIGGQTTQTTQVTEDVFH